MKLDAALAQAEELIQNTDTLVRVVLSGRRRNMQPISQRIDIRPVRIKGEVLLQTMENDGRQTTTRNFALSQLNVRDLMSSGYANILVEHNSGSMAIRVTKNHDALVHFDEVSRAQNLDHDRIKSRLLTPSDPFLLEVGITDNQGRVKPSRQDKYRQVEEFLRLLSPALNDAIAAGHIERPTPEEPLSIVDFGCGNAYLTFAAQALTANSRSVSAKYATGPVDFGALPCGSNHPESTPGCRCRVPPGCAPADSSRRRSPTCAGSCCPPAPS